MRQPGIVALHAVTSTNAFRYAFQMVGNDDTRRMILLQNAAFLPLFRQAMQGRGEVLENWITDLAEEQNNQASVEEIFQDIGRDTLSAAKMALAYLDEGNDPQHLMQAARQFIFLKGTDSHDYKFSSAVLEDYYHISPSWRNRFLASSVFKLRGASGQDNGLIHRVRSALT